MAQKKIDYKTLSDELDHVMSHLQNEDIDVDEAVKYYERGLELVKQLETYLEAAENKIKEIKVSFGAE